MNSIRSVKNIVSNSWMSIAVAIILILPFALLVGLIWKAVPVLKATPVFELLFSETWLPGQGKFGFFAFIISSVMVSFIGILIMIPLGLFPAIYLTQFASKSFLSVMRSVIDVLAGIPSVIHGVWGVLIVVPFVSNFLAPLFGRESAGYTIVAGGIVLAVAVIPYVLHMLLEVFRTIPIELKEVSLSLGTTYWETIKKVVLKKASPAIIVVYVLGLSKAFGETIAVLMVVGNVVKIPESLFDPGYPLPALIANNYGEMLSIPMYDSALLFSALLLFLIVLLFNLTGRFIISKTETLY